MFTKIPHARITRTAVALFVVLVVAPALSVAWGLLGHRYRATLPDGAVTLALVTSQTEWTAGDYPLISAILTNHSGRAIRLARTGDRGAPRFDYEIHPPPGALDVEPIGMCGNTNLVTANDFYTLEDGDSIQVFGGPMPNTLDRGPGDYTLQATYSTMESNPSYWVGDWAHRPWDSALTRLMAFPNLANIPRFTATSNQIVLHFTDPFPDPVQALTEANIKEATRACRTLAAQPASERPTELNAVLLDAMDRRYDPFRGDSGPYAEFLQKAIPLLAETATPDDADAFWTLLERERRNCRHRVFFENYHAAVRSGILTLALKSPTETRTDRFRYLLTEQCYQEGNHSERVTPVKHPYDAIPDLLFELRGDDIDALLIDLAHDPQLTGGTDSLPYQRIRTTLHDRNISLATPQKTH